MPPRRPPPQLMPPSRDRDTLENLSRVIADTSIIFRDAPRDFAGTPHFQHAIHLRLKQIFISLSYDLATGEGAISGSFRTYNSRICWNSACFMRLGLVHNYFDVQPRALYEFCVHHLEPMHRQILDVLDGYKAHEIDIENSELFRMVAHQHRTLGRRAREDNRPVIDRLGDILLHLNPLLDCVTADRRQIQSPTHHYAAHNIIEIIGEISSKLQYKAGRHPRATAAASAQHVQPDGEAVHCCDIIDAYSPISVQDMIRIRSASTHRTDYYMGDGIILPFVRAVPTLRMAVELLRSILRQEPKDGILAQIDALETAEQVRGLHLPVYLVNYRHVALIERDILDRIAGGAVASASGAHAFSQRPR